MRGFVLVLLMACAVGAEEWTVDQIADGFLFNEGPVWLNEGLVFSDVRGDTLYRWSEGGGIETFRKPSRQANGNTLDPEGRLVTCRHEARDVIRTEKDGSITVLADSYAGGKLNSPNDVVVQSDGTIWFTDPPYGLNKRLKEQPFNAVYRLDPGAAEPVAVVTNLSYPNGLAFSPDGTFLYIAESDWKIKPNFVMRYVVNQDGSLTEGVRFAEVKTGAADGIRVDDEGRLFCTSGLGVEVFDSSGRLVTLVQTPKPASNCCFGGADRQTLFITARDTVYRATRKQI